MNRNEKTWDPAFLAVSFRLKEGEISAPIKSKFGYHIIKLIQRNGDDVVIQHILRIPPVTETEINAAITKLDSVRSKIIAGKLGFNDAASKYSDDEQAKYSGPFILNREGAPYVTFDLLDKDMVTMISKTKVGDITQPKAFKAEQGKKGVRIVYLKSRSEPHRMNLHDDYSKISQWALEEKKSQALQKWLDEKISTYYIWADNENLSNCQQLKKYLSEKKAF